MRWRATATRCSLALQQRLGPWVKPRVADVRDGEAIANALGTAEIDVLVNNAGGLATVRPLHEQSAEETAEVVALDPTAPLQFAFADGYGIAIGGAAEFAGLKAPPKYGRSDALAKLAKAYLPDLISEGTRWMGHRPTTADTLPVIGFSHCRNDVIDAYGHICGLTLGPTTGRLVADKGANDRCYPFFRKPFS